MSERLRAAITGTGHYMPERVLTNHDLEKMVDTNDEWIVTRTGISERRIAADDQATSDLAIPAARQAIADAGLEPADIDVIIAATMSADMIFPATACLVQGAIGAIRAAAFDVSAACSGYGCALATAQGMINGGLARHVLVIGAETLSRITDFEDRGSCILFGDGAGATVLSAMPAGSPGEVLHTMIGADGANWQSMTLPGGGSRAPASHETVDQRPHYIKLRGREVFNLAVRRIVEIIGECVEACGLTTDDVDLFIPHQMNLRIMKAATERLGLPMDKLFVNIDRYGNTGAATVPVALSEAKAQGRAKPGDIIVLVTFGAGLTWSGAVLRW